jgi:hypothetical protein
MENPRTLFIYMPKLRPLNLTFESSGLVCCAVALIDPVPRGYMYSVHVAYEGIIRNCFSKHTEFLEF